MIKVRYTILNQRRLCIMKKVWKKHMITFLALCSIVFLTWIGGYSTYSLPIDPDVVVDDSKDYDGVGGLGLGDSIYYDLL